MATIQYARLYPDTTQLQAKDGHNLTAGWVEVYLAGTDDPAVTYADFNGTVNPQKIVVDDNGRFTAIVDKSKAYRVEVYDAAGALQWTTEPVWCTGNAGAGMSVTRVISTDGSIAVEENIDGSERTYDISIAPSDSDEFLEWIKCSEEDCGSTWHPVYQAGTMETEAGAGIKVHAGQLYHFTNTFYVDPDASGINYDTFKVRMYCNDAIVDERDFDIDSSLTDVVMCEFSTDLIPEADGVVYYKLTIPSTCEVTGELQCHRIYSGINAVPDTCATKQWVQETFDYNMAEKISYSALEYNNNGDISGISGSAIAGGLDSATVSAIASSYAESAISSISGWSGDFSSISSKVDQSAFDQCCDEVHSALDDKLDKSASGMFQPSSEMSAYVPFSGLDMSAGKITAISGTALSAGKVYTGISPVTVDNTADTIAVEHRTLCVDSTMTAYNSGSSAVIGVNVAGLDLSSKMDASASSLFYSTSNPSGFITGVDLTPYQRTADMSAYAHESSLSAKLDASAASEFYPTSNPSGFLTAHQSLAGYATEAYVDSSVSSKLDTTAFSTVSGDFLTSHQSLAGYATESYVDSAVSGKLDVTASSQFLTSLPDDLAYTSDVASAVSGKMDKSESSSFYPMDSNPSGYLTAHQSLAGYATETYVDSAVSGKLDATAYDSAEFYTTANPSGFVDASSASAIASAYQVVSSLGGDNSYVTSINSKYISATHAFNAEFAKKVLTGADATSTAYISSLVGIDSATCSAIASSYAESAASSKLDDSATADFYVTANPSGFIDGASASAIASAYQVVSATATQLNAGTAYLTSVNETPISASRAGNAANASLATSAWYDGTGRMISSLPDEATVSGIASAYAESAASSKQDTLTFDWDADSAISSINGSALAGQGGGAPIVVTGTAWDPDTSAYVYPTSNLSGFERHVWTYQNGNKSNFIEYLKDDSGNRFPMMAYFLAAGAEQMYNGGINGNGRLQFSPSQSMFSADGSNKYGLTPLTWATGASMNLSAGYFRASYRGDTIFISRGPSGTIDSSNSAQIKAIRIEAHNSRGSNISAYDATTTGYYGTTGMRLSRSGVFVDDSGNSSNTAASTTLTTGSLTFVSAGSSDVMRQSSIPYWNEKIDGSALGWLEVND